jgi:hypothetical protein
MQSVQIALPSMHKLGQRETFYRLHRAAVDLDWPGRLE